MLQSAGCQPSKRVLCGQDVKKPARFHKRFAPLDLLLTLAALAACAALFAWMIFLEKKPPEPGHTRLLPTTPIMFLAALGVVLALAHLVTLLTGTPHTGRFG